MQLVEPSSHPHKLDLTKMHSCQLDVRLGFPHRNAPEVDLAVWQSIPLGHLRSEKIR